VPQVASFISFPLFLMTPVFAGITVAFLERSQPTERAAFWLHILACLFVTISGITLLKVVLHTSSHGNPRPNILVPMIFAVPLYTLVSAASFAITRVYAIHRPKEKPGQSRVA
jgi:uncharacterized membrane protein YhaH (DUF805 family)